MSDEHYRRDNAALGCAYFMLLAMFVAGLVAGFILWGPWR